MKKFMKALAKMAKSMFSTDPIRLIRLTVNELEMQIANAPAIRSAFLKGRVLPDVSTAENVLQWNKLMLRLLENETWKPKDEFLYYWWKNTINRYPNLCTDIFALMRQAQIGKDAEEWAKVFPLGILLKHKEYGILLRLGYTKYLVDNGQAEYVIENFDQLQIAGKPQAENVGPYVRYARAISIEDMLDYVDGNPRKFAFFAMHPLGLAILAKNNLSGVIATMEKTFSRIGENFPEEFNLSRDFKRRYLQLLNNQLELNLAVV